MLILLTESEKGKERKIHISFLLCHRCDLEQVSCPERSLHLKMQEFVPLRFHLIHIPSQYPRSQQFSDKYKEKYTLEVSFE